MPTLRDGDRPPTARPAACEKGAGHRSVLGAAIASKTQGTVAARAGPGPLDSPPSTWTAGGRPLHSGVGIPPAGLRWCALRGGAYVATADSEDFGTAPPAATAAGRKPASLTCSMPDTGPGGPEGRRRLAPTTRPVSRVAGRVHQGPPGRFLAPPGPGRSPGPLPRPARRQQCPAFQVALLATGSATGTAASPRGLGREAGPASPATEGQSTNPDSESPSKRAARRPAATGICQRTTRRRPYGPLASAGQGTRSSAGPQPLPTSGYLTSRPNTLGSPPAWPFNGGPVDHLLLSEHSTRPAPADKVVAKLHIGGTICST